MKYWVYMNGEVPGCYTPQELGALAGFGQTTLVCPAEGEILEKNWRRSGEFPEIIKLLHERDASRPPSAPASSASPEAPSVDANLYIDAASARLFSHVADLVKELENRREERALTQSLQRQIVDLKEQTTAARERASVVESRLPRLAELEEKGRKDAERILTLEASVRARDEGLTELRIQLEKTRGELDAAKRRLGETANDLAIRNRLVDKLSRDLTEKELACTKALGVIRRLEEELHRLMPVVSALQAEEASAKAALPPAESPKLDAALAAPAEKELDQTPAPADEPAVPPPFAAPLKPFTPPFVVPQPRPVASPFEAAASLGGPAPDADPFKAPAASPFGSAPAANPFAAPAADAPSSSPFGGLAASPAAAPLPELPSLSPKAEAPAEPLGLAPAADKPADKPEGAAPAPAAGSYTTDEPTIPPPPAPLPADAPAAQQAIIGLFKRFLGPKDLH